MRRKSDSDVCLNGTDSVIFSKEVVYNFQLIFKLLKQGLIFGHRLFLIKILTQRKCCFSS